MGTALNITPSITTNGSAVTSCSISPQPPSPLVFNSPACTITGTPSATLVATTYSVTATNGAGTSTAVTFTLTNIGPPTISISPSSVAVNVGEALTISPTVVHNGATADCSITAGGALPGGVSLNAATCVISGTTTTVKAATTYTVTATNTAGSASANVTITVSASQIKLLKIDGVDYGSCAINSSGALKCWGYITWSMYSTAQTTAGLSSGVVSVSVSRAGHGCVLTNAGGVKCWGTNNNGQLGNGTTTNSLGVAVNVTGLTSGVAAIGVGDNHSCAVLNTGELRCWGNNFMGQLGNGTTTQSTTPVTVSGLSSGVVAVSGGRQHTCAMLTSGAVRCWGWGYRGQLGNNSTTETNTTPQNVTGLTSGVTQISAGDSHTCALLSSGEVKCWGLNSSGQLGDGSLTNRLTPVTPTGLTSGMAFISTSQDHTCSVTTAGAARCWGSNNRGKVGVGNNTTATYNTPQNVTLVTSGIEQIATGNNSSCVLLTSGSAKCWGGNGEGDLGNNWGPDAITAASDVVNFPVGCGEGTATLAATASILGSTITSKAYADNLCATTFGTGWRWATFHDNGGWDSYGSWGHSSCIPTTNGWMHIYDQNAHCYVSRATGLTCTPVSSLSTGSIGITCRNNSNPYSGDTACNQYRQVFCKKN